MISVIVPIYNVEKYLRKCIDSIIGQTYRDLQIILIDDGSPDGCGEICDEYAQKDSRIVVIHQKNSGVSAARNAGLKIAMGEYVGFVDPDDYIEPKMYEKMLEVFETNKVDLVVCGYDYVDENGTISRPYRVRENEILTRKQYVSMQFDMPPSVRHVVWNKLFHMEKMAGIYFPENLHSSEDVYVICDYIKNVNKAFFVHQPLYKNLVRQGSATHGGLKIDSLATSFEAHNKMHLEAIRLFPEVRKHSASFLLDVCLLKYNEAKRQFKLATKEEREKFSPIINKMRKFIKKYAVQELFNNEIFLKTRIAYLLIK